MVNWQKGLANGELRIRAEKSKTMVMKKSQETEIRTRDMNGQKLKQVDKFKWGQK